MYLSSIGLSLYRIFYFFLIIKVMKIKFVVI